jgi:RNA polymerase primary sigma factor
MTQAKEKKPRKRGSARALQSSKHVFVAGVKPKGVSRTSVRRSPTNPASAPPQQAGGIHMSIMTTKDVAAIVEAFEEPEAPKVPEIEVKVQGKGFTPDELSLYIESLQETCGYIADPEFGKSRADLKLFGDHLESIDGPSPREFDWLSVDDQVVESGPPPTEPLTAAQEQLLFRQLNFVRFKISKALEKINVSRPKAAEVRKVATLRKLVRQLRDRIVEANMPLVISMAKRARIGNVDFPELISEGNMALLRAVDKFDASRGYKFSTYACRAILKSFSRLAIRQGRYRMHFPTEYDPALEKSEWMDIKRGRREADVLSDLKEIILCNLESLDEVERTVIRERFALAPETLEEVGQIIGVTKERVRQIQNKALMKLRNVLEKGILAA